MPLQVTYRPTNFEEMIGNRGTIQSLRSCLEREDRPHAYMFCGHYGCGKTTLARITASVLGCDPESPDLVMIDGGTDRGIAVARQLKEMSKYKPLYGDSKVFLIDEAHQTTKDFQNALLGDTEDQYPTFAYFIFCTTEPEKIIPTIKSRFSIFQVNPLNRSEVQQLLDWVLKTEDAALDKKVLEEIVAAGEGIPRDTLKILDQVIDLPTVEDQLRAIPQALVDDPDVKALIDALRNSKKWGQIAPIIKEAKAPPEQIRQQVLRYFTAVLLGGDNARAALVLDCFLERPFYSGTKAELSLACFNVVTPG